MTTRDVHVRDARVGDAEAMAGLATQLGYPVDGTTMRGRLQAMLASTTHRVLVAEASADDDGEVRADRVARVVGWLAIERRLTLEGGVSHEITGLVVDAQCRRAGAGRVLVDAALDWARSDDARRVVVRSNVAREASHPFYESLGFARSKTQHVYVHAFEATSDPKHGRDR